MSIMRARRTHTFRSAMSLFDRIIAGQLPASFVHQDEVCVAFMDINPVARGHVLVVPRRCVATLQELDAVTRAHLWETAQRIGQAQQKALGSTAQHLLVNDGRDASQSVPHVHIHVVPRHRGRWLATVARLLWHLATVTVPRPETAARRKRLDETAAAIRAALAAGTLP